VLPGDGRVTRCLASHPPGPRGSSSPASSVLSRHCDFLPSLPPRFVAFAWRYHGTTHVSLPPQLRAATAGLGLFARYPRPGKLPWRRQDLPSSWGTSISVCTCSQTPAGRCVSDHFRDDRVAPADRTTKAPTIRTISGLNSMAFGLAVYASRCQLPSTAQDSLQGAGQTLLDGLLPARSHYKVSNHLVFLLIQASWRNLPTSYSDSTPFLLPFYYNPTPVLPGKTPRKQAGFARFEFKKIDPRPPSRDAGTECRLTPINTNER
jgi:hypothetical protein